MRAKIVNNRIVKQLSAWLPVILWAFLIFRFSSGTIPVASVVYWQDFAVKKFGHVLLFGILSIFIYRAFRMNKMNRRNAAIWAVVIATFYGATDEYHQFFTQGREARIRDVLIDCVGATLIVLAVYYLPPTFSKKIYAIAAKLDLV